MAMIQYISIFIDNIDWSNLQDIIILTLAHELISSKDEEIVSLSQKTKIASSNMTILSKLFTELLESMLKQPFKSVHNFTEYRILSECIRTNASICIILENFIENLFLECNNNFRILYAAHDIFSPLATNALPLETLDTTHLIHLSEDISTHWIRHQFKSYDWFLRSMVYVFSYVIRQYQQPRRDKNQQFEMTPMFRQSLVYLIRYIFGHDLSKDFELAQDSLLHIIQTLSKCEKISHSQFLSFIEDENMNDESGTTSFQPVPIHSLINLYMSMIFVRHDSKNFTYDQVIDLFLNDDTNQDFSIFTEKTLIILRWMDQMILLLNSPSSSMDTPLRRKFLSFHQRQLILLLGYLRVLPLFKKKCKLNNLTSHTSLSSLLLKFQEEYYEPLVAFWNHYKSNNPSTNNNLHINAFQTANHSILSFSQVQKELEEESSTTTTTTSTQHQTLKSLHGRDPLESGQNALSKHQILLIPLILSTFERISLFDDEEEVVVEDDGGG
nr:unnamed protein product [Naegleria fowleri]